MERNNIVRTKTIHVSLLGAFALGAFLVLSPFAIQAASAQMQLETFVIRLVGAVGQSGLVNIAVNNVAVLNNVEIIKNSPITVTANVPINAPITICAISVLSNQPVGCRTVNDAQQNSEQIITIPINSNRPL